MNALIEGSNKSNTVIFVIFMAGLAQGLALVSFPALSSVIKSALFLSDAAYGAIFLPQLILTATGAITGGLLAKRLGLTLLLRWSLVANGLAQIVLFTGVTFGGQMGYLQINLGTALLGLGFGLSAAPLNRYPVILFPGKPDSALTALHTTIGAGLAIGPWLAGILAANGHWPFFPFALIALLVALLFLSLATTFPSDTIDLGTREARSSSLKKPAFWLLFLIAAVYAICEGLFSNWAVIFLQEDRHMDTANAGAALSVFWAMLAIGRLVTAWLVAHFSAARVWLSFPILMAVALYGLPAIDSAKSALLIYGFAGLSCSGFFPLAVARSTALFTSQAALVSSMMISALMLGVGLGSFALGALRSEWPLSTIFQFAVVLPLVAGGLAAAVSFMNRRSRNGVIPESFEAENNQIPISPSNIVICPACGGANPEDAVFCGNHECHKALGEFKYVLEELQAQKNWIERLADKVTGFIAKPHFIIIHTFWFALWILANEGYLGKLTNFDEYPYSLLGIILAIEAVLITGFLLISQSHQSLYSEKRAELDYEVNIRSYRKLVELEKRLDNLLAKEQI